MCGIHGFIDQSLSNTTAVDLINKMANSTNHRGPDYLGIQQVDGGYFAHNRLSIIDLSSEGNQPMRHQHLTLVFNGEIYNYKEIKQELIQLGYAFTTKSDTEVILMSYLHWGKSCVNRFIGMWAFVIYDAHKSKLFCSRDRFGIKPFYYIQDRSKFYFSSEIKSLRNSDLFSSDLNELQVMKSIQMGWISYQNQTLFKNVMQLEPGCNLTIENGLIQSDKYWEITEETTRNNQEIDINEFKDLFIDAVKLHTRSDVKVGSTLSGGIDSSSIASVVVKENILKELNTFSIYYDGKGEIDERPFIEELIKKYSENINPNFLKPEINNIKEQFHNITYHNDFPLLGSSPISQYFIMKEISKFDIKVILSGQGADDYLGGYMHTYYRYYADLLSKGKFGKIISEAKLQQNYQQLGLKNALAIFNKSMASFIFNENSLLETEFKYGKTNIFNAPTFNLNTPLNSKLKTNEFHEAMLNYSNLPTLLHYEDRNSMAFSIESRVPFLDHRLVELAFKHPIHYKINNGYTKWILRESMTEYLPKSIKERKDKIGFVTPGESKWLRNELKHLLDINYSNIPNINIKKTKKMVDEFKAGDLSNAKIVWRLANLNYWMNNFC